MTDKIELIWHPGVGRDLKSIHKFIINSTSLFIYFFSFLLLTFSCKPLHYRKIKKPDSSTQQGCQFNPLFADTLVPAIYKAKIWVYKKYFSGIMVIKQTPEKTFRVIFMNELGVKFFDFEFPHEQQTQTQEIKVHYIMEQMNKPTLVNTLKDDLGLLFTKSKDTDAFYKKTSSGEMAYQTGSSGNKLFFYISDNHLTGIDQRGRFRKKKSFTLTDYSIAPPDQIRIEHKNIRLSIELNLIKKKNAIKKGN